MARDEESGVGRGDPKGSAAASTPDFIGADRFGVQSDHDAVEGVADFWGEGSRRGPDLRFEGKIRSEAESIGIEAGASRFEDGEFEIGGCEIGGRSEVGDWREDAGRNENGCVKEVWG